MFTDTEDVASDGRLFRKVLAAVTGNARSPVVESRVGTYEDRGTQSI